MSYTSPADAAALRIQDVSGNAAASFSDQDVENNTPPPANTPATGAPTITGTAQVGETLTVDTTAISDADGLDNVGYSYQWLADDTEVAGATDPTYTLVADDVGKAIKVQVAFIDDRYFEESLASEATEAVVAAATSADDGTIWSATMTVGRSGTTYGYSGFSETGELSPKEFSLEGSDYTVWVLGEDDGGQAYLILNQEIPVDFVLQLGAVRLASKDAKTQDRRSAYQYQWDVGTVSLSVGDKVEVGLRTDNNPATGALTIGGTVRVGETLTAVTSGIEDMDGLGNVAYTYQWIGDDAEITGATDPTYTLVDDDAGLTIKVQVSFFDDRNNPETLTSAATTAVLANVPDAPEHLNVSLHDTGSAGRVLGSTRHRRRFPPLPSTGCNRRRPPVTGTLRQTSPRKRPPGRLTPSPGLTDGVGVRGQDHRRQRRGRRPAVGRGDGNAQGDHPAGAFDRYGGRSDPDPDLR